jgi:hypothetical protein
MAGSRGALLIALVAGAGCLQATGFHARRPALLRGHAPIARAPARSVGSAAAGAEQFGEAASAAVGDGGATAGGVGPSTAQGVSSRAMGILARSFGKRLRSLVLVRACFAPAAACASAGLASIGLKPPAWVRVVIMLALMVAAQRVGASAPALVIRARLGAGLAAARAKFARKWRLHWRSYITIPFVAAATGWVTNQVAVWMIFYPLEFMGIPLWVQDGNPLGLLGWRGIVPAKTGAMAGRLVDTLSKLIDLPTVFARLEPSTCAYLLLPGVVQMLPGIVGALVPAAAGGWAKTAANGVAASTWGGLPADTRGLLLARTRGFVEGTVREMQERIGSMVDLRGLVVGEMLLNRRVLVDLFQTVGRCELSFLVNSGLVFGFVLGLGQMLLWVLYDAPWTLALGGAVVGYLTNWIALKLIFEPVEPVAIGPWRLQGLFLTRQAAVSDEFAANLVPVTLTSEKLWGNIIGGSKAAQFDALLRRKTSEYVDGCATILFNGRPTELASADAWAATKAQITEQVVREFPKQLHRVHPYADGALALQPEIAQQMRQLSTSEFEQVLHPIFEEDELTLILVGGVLGLLVGYLQAAFTQPERDPGDDQPPTPAELQPPPPAAGGADGPSGITQSPA